MRIRLPQWIWLVFTATALAGCGGRSSGSSAQATTIPEMRQICAAVRESDVWVLYEGLPDRRLERARWESLKASTETIKIHDFFFHESPKVMTPEAGQIVIDLLRTPATYRPRNELPKPCGDFHADWCIRVQRDQVAHDWLICFNCGEVKAYGPDTHAYVELHEQPLEKLKEILEPYRTRAPDPSVPQQPPDASAGDE